MRSRAYFLLKVCATLALCMYVCSYITLHYITLHYIHENPNLGSEIVALTSKNMILGRVLVWVLAVFKQKKAFSLKTKTSTQTSTRRETIGFPWGNCKLWSRQPPPPPGYDYSGGCGGAGAPPVTFWSANKGLSDRKSIERMGNRTESQRERSGAFFPPCKHHLISTVAESGFTRLGGGEPSSRKTSSYQCITNHRGHN